MIGKSKMDILDSSARRLQRPKWAYLPILTRRTVTLGLVVSLVLLVMLRSFPRYDSEPSYYEHSNRFSSSSTSKISEVQDNAGAAKPPPNPAGATDNDSFCEGFPDVSNIAIIMKTGASESFGKIPVQLLSNMRCVSNGDFLIFSDMEETIGGVRVRDSLDNVLPEVQLDNHEFDIYREQKDCIVDQEKCFIDQYRNGDDRPAGWRLDKYKNIHMAEKVWKLLPGRDWYFFIDADTYVFWETLVLWLKQLDPKRKHFFGNIHDHGTGPFAHGGSGYILSRPALSELLDKNPNVAHTYDKVVVDVCCGDLMFSQAMKEKTDIDVVGVWPTLSEESFWTTPYGPWAWCQPVASLHHMSAQETSLLWEFERKRYATTAGPQHQRDRRPILFRDVYQALVADRVHSSPLRRDWDNWSAGWVRYGSQPVDEHWTDAEKKAHMSENDCKAACAANKGCFQWSFSWERDDGTCKLGWSFRLGVPTKKDSGMNSGWMLDRIEKFIKEQNCDKKKVEWKLSKGLP